MYKLIYIYIYIYIYINLLTLKYIHRYFKFHATFSCNHQGPVVRSPFSFKSHSHISCDRLNFGFKN